MTLTHDEKIKGFVDDKNAALKGREYTYSRLRVILDQCGWWRRGAANTQRIQEACENEGIYPEPMLTAPGIDWEETIYFSRVEPTPYYPELYSPHPAFSSERALQHFLRQNLRKIPALSRLRMPVLEYELPSTGRIDIFCREAGTNDYVVIELKKFATDPVSQIRRYLVEVEERLASQESPTPRVKGIIITGQPNAVLERTLPDRIPDFEVTWFLYRVNLELLPRAHSRREDHS